MTSKYRHAMFVASESASVERTTAMGLRKKLANQILGQDVDDLCMAWHTAGYDAGYNDGIQKAVDDIITDLLSDVVLSMNLDTETMQRIVEIIEN
jgi:hypothetical protein